MKTKTMIRVGSLSLLTIASASMAADEEELQKYREGRVKAALAE